MFLLSCFCLFLTCCYGEKALAQEAEQATLTMSDAVAIALANKPSLQSYKYAIQASKAQGMQVWSAYLPQVNVTTNISQSTGQQDPQTNITLGAQQLIYSFAGPIQKYKLAEKQTKLVELALDKDKKAIKYAVEQAFIECWKIQQQQKAINSLYTATESNFKINENAYKLNLLDKNEWLKTTSERDITYGLVDRYFQGVELTQKKLEFFMGQPIDLALKRIDQPLLPTHTKPKHITTLDLSWELPQEFTIKPLRRYYKYAMKYREEFKEADQKIAIAKDETTIAQRSNLPSLSAVAATGYQSIENKSAITSPNRSFYNLGLQLSWPIFNGLSYDYAAKAAHSTMLKEVILKDNTLQTIKLDIETAYHTLSQAVIVLKAKQSERDYVKNNSKLKKLQLQTGDITQSTLNRAIADEEKVEYEWIELAADAATKERALAYACGYPPTLS